MEKPRQGLTKHWLAGRHLPEKCHARPKFKVIWRVKNLKGICVGLTQKQLGAFDKPLTEHWMLKIGHCLLPRLKPEVLGHRASSKAFELRKNEPYPMRGLLPQGQFAADQVIDPVLRLNKSLKALH
jgi:hypothetical protein